MRYLINTSTDPAYNLAFDDWCLEHLQTPDTVFCLWRNAPSVIIGRNQKPEAEVNLQFLREQGIILVRRSTGGGAVYHDLGNVNYSFFRPILSEDNTLSEEFHDRAVENIAAVLQRMGVDARIGGRNDIFVGERKVSGFAKRIWRDRVLVHGTLMYDVDLDTLTQALDAPGSKLRCKGVTSVRSRVMNLREMLPQFGCTEEFMAALQSELEGLDGGNERLDVFFPGRPAGAKTHGDVSGIGPLPVFKTEITP